MCLTASAAVSLSFMLAANVWHWWIGVLLTLGIVLLVVVIAVTYLATVTAQKHPRGKNRPQHSDL